VLSKNILNTSTNQIAKLTKDNNDPRVITLFKESYAFGKSGILRGIPAVPNQCIGKKVMFAPKNKAQKCILASKLLY